ncbi:hypothetical protein [Bacillus sp. AK128]
MFEMLETIYIPSAYTIYVSMIFSMIFAYLFYINTKANITKRKFDYIEIENIHHDLIQTDLQCGIDSVFVWLMNLYRKYESTNDDEDSLFLT